MLVALRPQKGLAAYAHAVSTPGSAEYHDYLTPSQFRVMFGASAATIGAVDAALRSEGLSPGAVSANGLTIPVTAPATSAARAFHTSFERVVLKTGRLAYANTSAPALPTDVSNAVQGVIGLDSLSVPEPQSLVRPRSIKASDTHVATARISHVVKHTSAAYSLGSPCIANGTGSYWNAGQIAQAYGFNGYYAASDEGAGQTVALFELEPNLTSDITLYANCYGANPTVNYIRVDGGATGPGAGSGEAALDIEQIVGLAPAATIDVFQAPNTGQGAIDDYQAIVDTAGVNVLSTSWGACEAANGSAETAAEATIFEQAATEGISVYAASGDSGSSDCYPQNNTPAVDDPASQPYVTGAGGTSLPEDTATSQTTWNDSATQNGAGGGGVSSVWTMPSYQAGAAGALNVINSHSSGSGCGATSGSYCREVPDVSANADPQTGYPIYWKGKLIEIGGTSAVAPLWAAYTALVNASALCNSAPIGFANPLLYTAADNQYASDFTDVTSGNNDYTPDGYSGGLYPAGTGYDMATGLGSPVGTALGATLCTESDRVSIINPGQQTGEVNASVDLTLSAADSQRHQLTFSAAGLPSGLAIDSTTGVITGQLPSTPGAYTVTVTATSVTTGASTSQSFAWTVTSASSSNGIATGSKGSDGSPTSGGKMTTRTSVRFYRCVRICQLIHTHGATTYKPRKADYGRYLKVLTSVTRDAGGVKTSSTSTRWIGPITAATAGDISIGSGARIASRSTVSGATGRALARVQIAKRHGSRLTLVVRRATRAATQTWAYVVSRGVVVSATRMHSLRRPARLTITLRRGQTIRLVAVRS